MLVARHPLVLVDDLRHLGDVLAHTDDADDLVFTILSHGVLYDTISDTVLTRLCCRNSCRNYPTSTVPHPTTCRPQGFDSLYLYRTVADDLPVRTAQRRGV